MAALPAFVARCLEEVGLEGRCGLPLRAAFELMDPAHDVALRRCAWRVLRGLPGTRVRFHHMQRLPAPVVATAVSSTVRAASPPPPPPLPLLADSDSDAPPRRKRKWSTTLLPTENGGLETEDERDREEPLLPRPAKVREPVVPSARRQALRRQKRQKLLAHSTTDEKRGRKASSPVKTERRWRHVPTSEPTTRPTSESLVHPLRKGDSDPTSADWVLRSPRGFVLGVEVDVSDLSYEDAVTDAAEGVLGVVACETLRLQYLGVTDPTAMDTLSPQFDLLELIGRARARGENAATLTNSNVFGDSRKLHYLLDMLVAGSYVEKNMVTADHKRFNIVHLTRFVRHFHPSMVSPTATMERESFPKHVIPFVMAEMLAARGERTCVFADIGRELGYDKRYQEKLRKYFAHQMHVASRDFPLELFMARCNTGASDQLGRKLWCIRLRHGLRRGGSGGNDSSAERFEPVGPPAPVVTGPVVERGLMEQMYTSIQRRCDVGATIPELRDMLGVPTFKLPYKLAQGLISKYNLTVRQVVVGKSTMYRMFIPGNEATAASLPTTATTTTTTIAPVPASVDAPSSPNTADPTTESEAKASESGVVTPVIPQPSTMKEASRGVLVSTTYERRRNYILERVRKNKVVPVHQLRTELTVLERNPAFAGTDLTAVDTRSIRRILDEFEAAQLVVSVDITLPPRRVLQKRDRVVKCVCLPGCQRDRDIITKFVDVYVEEQQRRYVSDVGPPEMPDVVVVSTRSRARRRSAPVQNENTEVVTYAAGSYRTARVNLVKLGKQSRRLGLFFGMLYRCRALHLILWANVETLREKARAMASRADANDVCSETPACATETAADGGVVFALHELLDLMSLKEYLQLAGVNELLTDAEESKVRMAIVRGDTWAVLSNEIQVKIRGCEVDRFSRIVRTLIELDLVQVANDSSTGLLDILRSDDFDAMVSQVASATLSGGLLKLKDHACITVKCGDATLTELSTAQSYVYAARFSGRSENADLVGKIPLAYVFKDVDDAKEYWKALRFLSVEGAHLGSGELDGDTLTANVDTEQIRSAPLAEHNLYSLMSWIPRGMSTPGRNSAKSKAVEAAAEPMRILKRKRFQNNVGKAIDAHKKARVSASSASLSVARKGLGRARLTPPFTDTTEAAVSKFRRLVSAKQSARASKWTLEEDLTLMDAYVDELSSKWFIEIPLALQRRDERLAFRNSSLERAHISWKKLSKALGKRFTDCYLRVNELLTVPAVRARVEGTKLSMTQMKNPGGRFHEELALLEQPRLAALLNRALQIVFHDRSSYHPVLADMLISQWSEAEVKLVWRYLWLAGVITRTRKLSDGEQQERGFCIHSRVFEMKSLNLAHYPLDVFCEAAEYASFVQENVKEAAMLEGDDSEGDAEHEHENENECYFEREFEQNASAGQTAVELSSMILSVSEMVPEYVEPSVERRVDAAAEDAKRAVAVKGFAGHLAGCCGGATPDDFLKEYWVVKSRAQVLLDEAQQEAVMARAKQMEAFSTSSAFSDDVASDDRAGSDNNSALPTRLVDALNAVASSGLSFKELCAALQARSDNDSPVAPYTVRQLLDALVRSGRVIEVSAFTHARFVLREHGEIWTLRPYRVSNESAGPRKLHFRFDKEQTVVARPWYLLDGATNTRVELMLKRKVVNIVMCCPGIQDSVLHRKMRKLLSLQNLRALVDELVGDEIVYARLVTGAARQPKTLFDSTSWRRPRVDSRAVRSLAPGDAQFVDASRDAIHYFPAVNCMELLGAAACDADVRRN